AVCNDGGQSDLNLRIIDRLRDLASRVPHAKPEGRSPYDCQEKPLDSHSSTESAGNHGSKQNLENDHRRPIIQKTLKRLSPSIMTESRLFILRSLKMARTEIGSLAEMIAPNIIAIRIGGPIAQ